MSRSTPQGSPFSGRKKLPKQFCKRSCRSTPQGSPFSGSPKEGLMGYIQGCRSTPQGSPFPGSYQEALKDAFKEEVAVPRRVFHFQEAYFQRQ